MNLPKFPHSAMLVGVTACGKTEFLLKLLETIYKNHFEFIMILCPTILDNKTCLSRKWIFDDKNVFIVCDLEGKLNEWIELFKNTLKGHQTLFIIDDCSAEGEINKKRDALSELAFSGHHRNHSLWVLTQKYNSVSKDVREQIKWHIKLTRAKGYFTHDINGGGDNMFTADSICEMIEFLIDNIFVQFGGCLFRQVIGIPMGTNCAPLLADLFLYSYENEFLDNMIRSGHRRLARSFNLCYRYIDDLIVFNKKKFLDYLKEIYPSQLTVEKANKSDHLADYLDLTFIIDSGGKLSTRLYDKCDDFDFHIVNFPFLSSNIPSGPSYGVYISQLIRYARCCSHYDDFRYRHKCLVDRLLSQGYKALRLEKSFKKFYGRYQDLIEKYRRSVNAMVSDSFPGQFLFNM